MDFLPYSNVEGVALLLGGACFGYWLSRWKERQLKSARELEQQAAIESTRREAETLIREARLTANEETLKLREQTERAFSQKRQELDLKSGQIADREQQAQRAIAAAQAREQEWRHMQEQSRAESSRLEGERTALTALARQAREHLVSISRLSETEARAELMKTLEQEAQHDAANLSRHLLDTARTTAEAQARRIISIAIQRYAGSHTFDTTSSSISLTNEEIKGRIIGREGRNIRAFENATGVTVLIDDAPNTVVLSGFDPVRREIARDAMSRLIQDGRIHPTRIEEVVNKVKEEMDEAIVKAGEEALYRLGLPPMHAEVIRLLGRLKFRHSFSQNVLDHSIEVAQLSALMAAELGVNVVHAKKAGLLHDIGKAVNHEIEGAHALVGAELLKRYGEADEVVNGVAAHHDEAPHEGVFGLLVGAADAISASRPGARSESMTTYLKRLENLEKIAASFTGVDKSFAVQAGRELRVFVVPEVVPDEQAHALARALARRIEDELQYPGQIRVTVIRETRCIEFAK